MKPTLEQRETGLTTWAKTHNNVSYSLSHHGISTYSPQGIWCYYLFLTKGMFQNPEHFEIFNLPAKIEDDAFSEGKFRCSYDYYDLPEQLSWHGGITWYSKEPHFNRDTGVYEYTIKIGCDYAHIWDEEAGYWHGLDDVDRDAKNTIDELANLYPLNVRCKWSGKMGPPSEFYMAKNGCMIHNSYKGTFDESLSNYDEQEILLIGESVEEE